MGKTEKVLALKELTFSQRNNKKEKEGRKGGREGGQEERRKETLGVKAKQLIFIQWGKRELLSSPNGLSSQGKPPLPTASLVLLSAAAPTSVSPAHFPDPHSTLTASRVRNLLASLSIHQYPGSQCRLVTGRFSPFTQWVQAENSYLALRKDTEQNEKRRQRMKWKRLPLS